MNTDNRQWRKSTKSGPWTDNCLEAAYVKSSESGSSGNCVEAHERDGLIHVRNSRDPEGAYLVFDREEWDAFIDGVRAGDLGYEALAAASLVSA